MVEVSVIVPARDAEATLGRALEALARQTHASFEVIVVDDGSTDSTAAIAERADPPAKLLRTARSGPGNARNAGVEAAAGAVLAFTDADCFPEPGWLAAGVAALGSADLVQGRVVPDPGARRGAFDRTIAIAAESPLYEAANLFVRRETFDGVGGFEDWLDVRAGKGLGEDVWFGWKVRRAGGRTAFAADAVVHHAVFPRGPLGFIAERRRLFYFPALIGKIPELRAELCWRRIFLTRRSAAFALALAGVLAAGALAPASAGAVAPAPLLAAAPWLAETLPRALRMRRWGPIVFAADAAADAVGLAAMLAGSLRSGRLLL